MNRKEEGPRSFDLTDGKLAEADFFLEKMAEACMSLAEIRFYFSAFVSAARSLTFSIQAVMAHVDTFPEWYKQRQQSLKENPIARFFNRARTESQHIGINQIASGFVGRDETGKLITEYYFDSSDSDRPETDVVTACKTYLSMLACLVAACYQNFGTEIDPMEYYSADNIRRLGISIEDIEEGLGFPRGWTYIGSCTEEERLQALRRQIPGSDVGPILDKYLGENWRENKY